MLLLQLWQAIIVHAPALQACVAADCIKSTAVLRCRVARTGAGPEAKLVVDKTTGNVTFDGIARDVLGPRLIVVGVLDVRVTSWARAARRVAVVGLT